jgi:hypothetical protein
MKICVEISEHLLDDFQRTGFLSKDQRNDVFLLRDLVFFLVLESARDLPSAMRFSQHLAQRREAQAREWQAENAARDYYGNDNVKGASA